MASVATKIAKRLSRENMSYYLQRKLLKPATRQKVSSYISSKLPKATYQEDYKKEIAELTQTGIVPLPDAITPQEVQDIIAWSKQVPLNNAYVKGTFTYDEHPAEAHTGHPVRKEIPNCPHLLRVANDPKYLSIAAGFLGCQPTISLITIWWSFAGRDKPVHAELFHRDVDDWKFVKLFIYLTEVDEETGPHIYVKNSVNSDKCLKIRRYEDQEVEEAFGKENILCLTGHAGETFMENTYGFHKGTMPTKKNRLIMQVQYSLKPIAYEYSPIAKQDLHVNGFKMDPYINRLFVKQ